jgi:hypothetical protein
MSRYAKAITAFFTALGTWGVTAFADGTLTTVELFGLCGVIVVTAGVFQVPNTPPDGEWRDPNISERDPVIDEA